MSMNEGSYLVMSGAKIAISRKIVKPTAPKITIFLENMVLMNLALFSLAGWEESFKRAFDFKKRLFKRLKSLFAQCMEMKPRNALGKLISKVRVSYSEP